MYMPNNCWTSAETHSGHNQWSTGISRIGGVKHNCTALDYPPRVVPQLPAQLPATKGKMGGNGAKWGEMGKHGETMGKYREIGWRKMEKIFSCPPKCQHFSKHVIPLAMVGDEDWCVGTNSSQQVVQVHRLMYFGMATTNP